MMIRCASILASILLVGCMAAPGSDLRVDLQPEIGERMVADDSAALVIPAAKASPSEVFPVGHEFYESQPLLTAESLDPRLLSAPVAAGLRQARFTVKGGYYSSEDAEELDDGYIVNLSWMEFLNRFFALEVELGFFDADGESSGVEADVWGVPAMVNGRLNVPIWVLDVYGGLGVGEIYYDAEADGGVVSVDADGWLFGGNAFLGATVNLADSVALGLEAKYYLTEEIDDLDASLDAFAVMVTLGFARQR